MENMLGLLRLHVIRGVNLAIRDSQSSDPYVIVRMGKQVTPIFHLFFSNLGFTFSEFFCSCQTKFSSFLLIEFVK